MKNQLDIDGKVYVSSSRAAEMSKYSKDYIGQLSRSKKIDARMVGRSWYVGEASLLSYKEASEKLLEQRYEQYSTKTSQIIDHVEPVQVGNATSPVAFPSAVPPIVWQYQYHESSPKLEPISADSSPVFWKYKYSRDDRPLLPELKKIKPVTKNESEKVIDIIHARPNAIKSPFVTNLRSAATVAVAIVVLASGSVYAKNHILPLINLSSITAGVNTNTATLADAFSSVGSFIGNILGSKPTSTNITHYISYPYYTSATSTTSTIVVTKPTTNTSTTVVVNSSALTRRVANLEEGLATLRQQISGISTGSGSVLPFSSEELTQIIGQNISNAFRGVVLGGNTTTIISSGGGSGSGSVTSIGASGGSTGLSFSGGPITTSGTLTLTGVVNVATGGTGISSSPTYGQVLLGNSSGGYDLVATSTLGLGGSSGTVSSVNASGGTTGLTFSGGPVTTSGTLTLAGTLAAANGGTGISSPSAASLLLGSYAGGSYQQLATSSLGLITTNVAEGSNLYYLDSRVNSYINGSSTIPKSYSNNTFSGNNTFNGSVTVGTLNGLLQAVNGVVSASSTIGNAQLQSSSVTINTTGGLSGGGSVSLGGVLTLSGAGIAGSWATTSQDYYNSISRDWRITAGALSPTTTLGLLVNASSTIGNGTTAGGLTIFGGATTTSLVVGSLTGLLLGTNGAVTSIATSSLGLLTTNVAEGTNLYYTDVRVNSYINGSSTIPKTYTNNTFTGNNTFTYASTTMVSAQTLSTTNLIVTGAGGTGTKCLQVANDGTVSTAAGACGTSGGSSSGGSWSTTTSQVANEAVNYSNLNSDIVAIGGTSTTTAKFYFDPNNQQAYLSNLNIGSLTGILQGISGSVSASSTLSVAYGGTGVSSFGQGWIFSNGAVGALSASTSPTVNYLLATSTTFASRFPYASTTAISAQTASTTNLVLSSAGGVGTRCLQVGSDGTVTANASACAATAAAYPFGLTGNATSSLTQFNGGLTAYASSTIGNGLNGGGLTINGTATTTGTTTLAVFGGNVGVGSTSPMAKLAVTGSGTGTGKAFLVTDSSNTERFKILDDGTTRVGFINSGDNNGKFTVSDNFTGGSYDSAQFSVSGNNGDQRLILGYETGADFGIVQSAHYNVAFTNLVLQPGGGNVGIGDTSPSALFTVGNGDLFQVNSSGAIAASTAIVTSGGYSQSGTSANTFGGNVGIGTTSPYASLSVDGRGVFNQDVRANYFTATSTTLASTFPYASTTMLSAQAASTTNLIVSSAGGTGTRCLQVGPDGTVTANSSACAATAAAYPFGLTGNATSSLTQFNGGLTAYASSTIGNGTQAGGLTIFGGATTTNLAFTNLAGALLAVNGSGQVVATSTIGNAQLQSSSITVNTSGGLTGGGVVSLGGTLTISGPSSGATKFATTSNGVALIPNGGTNIALVLGRTATTSNSILEVNGTTTATNFVATSTTLASTFPYASTTAITSQTASTTNLIVSSAGGTGTRCLQVAADGTISAASANCVTGSGGGNATWSTTTSTVSGQAVNYSNLTTDIVAIGGTSTTTAAFYFDPNAHQSKFAFDASNYLTTTINSSGGVSMNIVGTTGGLLLNNPAPTSVSTQFGTNATSSFRVIGALGGNTTYNGGSAFAGSGAGISLVGGEGGSGNNSTASALVQGGDGGAVQVTSGKGANVTNGATNVQGGAGGALVLSAGIGGNASGASGSSLAGNGGNVYVFGGTGGTGTTNGSAGNLYLGSNQSSTNIGKVFLGSQSAYDTSTGRLGIGTTSPYASLSVDGRGVFNQDVRANYFTATSTTLASNLAYASTTMVSATTASTTNLVVSSAGGVGTRCLQVGSDGTVSANTSACLSSTDVWATTSENYYNSLFRDWKITAGALAPTTTLGILLNASSTIGNGTQAGGLTIFGGATTTGNAYFAGNVTSGTLNVGTLTGPLQAVNGVVTSSSTLSVFYGGTGLSTLPAYGNLLVGNAGGGYTLTGTSSLNFITTNVTEGTNLYYTDARVNSYINASSTIPKTYTNNIFTGNNTFSYASTTMVSATTASTTNLIVSSAGGVGTRCLQVGSDGTVSANSAACLSSSTVWATTSSDYYNSQFRDWRISAGALAPTTTLGILLNASSTIGNGTGLGGLTTFGNSTTTGSSYIAGNLGIGTNAPEQLLSLKSILGASQAGLSIERNGIQSWRLGISSTSPDFQITNLSTDFSQSKFTILSGGNVGIGTTSPGSKLSVSGDAYISGTTTANIFAPIDATSTRNNLGLASAGDISFNLGLSVAAWGDSLTQGNPFIGLTPYPTQLSLLTGTTTYNGGVGGETSTQIAVRQGGVSTTATISGGQIPASGGVTVTFTSGYEPITSQSTTLDIYGSISGVYGRVTLSGGVYTFTRSTAGSVVNVASAPLIVDTMGRNSGAVIIWVGRNNFTNPTQVKSDIAAMVASLGHTRYLVLGVTNDSTETVGTGNYNTIVALNNDLAAIYGNHYGDIRSYLVSQYDPNNAQDVIDFGNDVKPTSLSSDTTHLNAAGYKKVAEFVYQREAILFNASNRLLTVANIRSILATAFPIGVTASSTGTFSALTVGSTTIANGLVGIGTSTPKSQLHVYSGASGYTPVAYTTITAEAAAGATANYISVLGGGELGVFFAPGSTSNIDAGIVYNNGGSKGLQFRANGNDIKLSINSNGNVGIGTTTPYAKLAVVGQAVAAYFTATTSSASTFPFASTTMLTASAGLISSASSTIGSGLQNGGLVTFGGATTTGSAYIAGNLGIGQKSPEQLLSILGATSVKTGIILEQDAIQAWRIGMAAGANDLRITNTSADFSDSKFELSSAGNVGIGSTTPYAKLSVDGRGIFNQDVRANYFTATSTTLASTFPYASTTAITSQTASTTNLIVSSAGGVGTRCLQVAFDGTVSANSSACGTGASSAYDFPLTGNATSTKVQFNGGLTAFASSTIGNGNQNGGLVTFGGATTTGSSYIAGNLGIGQQSPEQLLSILGATSVKTGIILEQNAIQAWRIGMQAGNGDFRITNATADFSEANTKFAITSGGNIGIGTTTPYARLSVDGRGIFNQDVRANYFTATSTTLASTFPYASTTMVSATTASTTNLIVSSAGGVGTRCLQVGSDGTVSANASACASGGGSAYPFTLTGNATSTLTQFNGGLTSFASTTIGGGTQATGLTIFGGATTTGGNFIQRAYGNPTLKGTISLTGSRPAFVSGKYAYVPDWTSGLRIVDVSNPAAPVLIGTYDTSGTARSVFVSGKYAYEADAASGLYIIDVSNPANPTLVSNYDTPDSALWVTVSGKYAYVMDQATGLMIFDVSNPAVPVLVGTYDPVGVANAMAVYVSGKYAYLAAESSGLEIVDISNPAAPVYINRYNTSDTAQSVYVSGKYAYVADYDSLDIIDVSNPASPATVANFATPGNAYGVYVAGKYAYVADDTSGLQVIDVSIPASPVVVGTYDTPGNAIGVFVSGKYAYVSDDAQGLQIIDINGMETPALYAGNIETNVLNATENINVGGDIYAQGGLNVGISGIFSRGTISAFVASTTQTNPTVANFMGGNVGIGTTSPYAALSVVGASGVVAGKYTATSTTATSTFAGFIDVLGTGTNSTSTISSNLWVKGTLRSAVSYVGDLVFANNFRFIEAPASTSPQTLMLQDDADNNLITFSANGNIGIGTTTPSYKLHVLGDVAAQSFVNISTRDAKKDITYLSDSDKALTLDKIRDINIAKYHYNDETSSSSLHLGLIAEEAPSDVLAAGGKGVDVYKFSSFILGGVQALDKKVTGLTDAGTSLSARMDAATNLLSTLSVTATSTATTTTELTMFDLIDKVKTMEARINSIDANVAMVNAKVDALASTTQNLALTSANLAAVIGVFASTSPVDASTTAANLATSTSFIQAIATAVQNLVATAGEWTVNKLTTRIAYIDRVEAKTVAVSKGMEFTDQATGQIYCVVIRNGNWDKNLGSCDSASTTPTTVTSPVVTPAPIIIIPTPEPTATSTATTTPEVIPTPEPTATTTPTPEPTTPTPEETPAPTPAPAPTPIEAPTP